MTNKYTDIEIVDEATGEIQTGDPFGVGTLSVLESIDEERFASMTKTICKFQEMCKKLLVDGHDYGKVGNFKRPCLLKPGAEKILILMGVRSEFEVVEKERRFEDGFVYYAVKCSLYTKNGDLVTEGLGACNSLESRYIPKTKPGDPPRLPDAYTLDNTILKVAKKRAMVDATLLVGSLSDVFTQDVEDLKNVIDETRLYTDRDGLISNAQAQELFRLSGYNKQICQDVIAPYGYKNAEYIEKKNVVEISREIQRRAEIYKRTQEKDNLLASQNSESGPKSAENVQEVPQVSQGNNPSKNLSKEEMEAVYQEEYDQLMHQMDMENAINQDQE